MTTWLTGIGNVQPSTVNHYSPHYGERECQMKGLYEVWIIDPKEEVTVWSATGSAAFVAAGDEGAKLAAVQAATEEGALPLGAGTYTYLVRRVGDLGYYSGKGEGRG